MSQNSLLGVFGEHDKSGFDKKMEFRAHHQGLGSHLGYRRLVTSKGWALGGSACLRTVRKQFSVTGNHLPPYLWGAVLRTRYFYGRKGRKNIY